MSRGSFVAYRQDVMDPRHGAQEGVAWAQAIGGAQDTEMALLRAAALSRLPVYVPDDGLDKCGVGFNLPRMPGEVNASYRARLIAAWPTYAEAGSSQAVIDALHAYGVTDVRIVQEEGNHGVAAAYSSIATYNKGALVVSSGNVYEMVGSTNGATPAGTAPTGTGQAQSDGGCTWAWRCAATADTNDPGYSTWWYSRFDVVLGGQTKGNFGTLAVAEFAIQPPLGVTTLAFTQPAIGSSVSVSIAGTSLTQNSVVYVSQGGYYQVVSGSGPYVLLNLGDANAAWATNWSLHSHPTGAVFAPDVWGAAGQFPNLAAGYTVASGQTVVTAGTCGIVGQTRIGCAIVDDAARIAIKALILRWKATHGYVGRIVLASNGTTSDPAGNPGYYNGLAYVGASMIGVSTQIPFVIGGYNRS